MLSEGNGFWPFEFKFRQYIGAALLILVIMVLLGGVKFFQIRKAMAEGAKMGPPPQAVTTTVLIKKKWNKIVEAYGRVDPVNGALIKAESSGRVSNITMTDGAEVSKDQLLLEIEAEVEKAQFEAAQAKALLSKKLLADRIACLRKKQFLKKSLIRLDLICWALRLLRMH